MATRKNNRSDTSKRRGPIRKYATRKVADEPSVLGGLWFKCTDEQYQSFENAATREGLAWVNHWAMMHLINVCRSGQSKSYSFPKLKAVADHIQPADREGTGVWIDSPGQMDSFSAQATREHFPTVLQWGLHHLGNIATHGESVMAASSDAA